MKFQVSVLNDKGGKKAVATVEADYYTENDLAEKWTRIEFWAKDYGWFKEHKVLVGEVMWDGAYVVEVI